VMWTISGRFASSISCKSEKHLEMQNRSPNCLAISSSRSQRATTLQPEIRLTACTCWSAILPQPTRATRSICEQDTFHPLRLGARSPPWLQFQKRHVATANCQPEAHERARTFGYLNGLKTVNKNPRFFINIRTFLGIKSLTIR
jgi:hypothetical protein